MNLMDDTNAQKARARRTIILLYGLMAAGVLLPLAFWWFKP